MPPKSWTSTSLILRAFGTAPSIARRAYSEYVLWRLKQSLPDPLAAAGPSGILGKPEFIERVEKTVLAKRRGEINRDLPQLRKLRARPGIAEVSGCAEDLFGPKNKYARRVAILVIHKNTDYSLREIGDFFKIGISGVTDIYRRTKRELLSNDTLAQAVQEMERRFFS
jgi:hypothetical protein